MVRRSSSMMPIFTVLRGRPSISSTRSNVLVGKGHFVRPVHLRLDDVDRARLRVAAVALSMSCTAISAVIIASIRPSGTSLPSRSRIAGLVIRWPTLRTSIRARALTEISPPSGAVNVASGLSARVKVLPPFRHLRREIALHQAEPVAVGEHLVLGVDAGDRILAIHDRRNGAFEPHIGKAGLIARADRMGAVEHELDMQPVVDQQHRVGRLGSPR